MNPSQSDSRTLHVISPQEPFLSLPLVLTRDSGGGQHGTQQRLILVGRLLFACAMTWNSLREPSPLNPYCCQNVRPKEGMWNNNNQCLASKHRPPRDTAGLVPDHSNKANIADK